MNVDDLELELRKLPGVRAAGFTERDDVLLIQLQVSGDDPPSNLPLQATRIAYRHSDKPVALEVVRWRVVARGRVTSRRSRHRSTARCRRVRHRADRPWHGIEPLERARRRAAAELRSERAGAAGAARRDEPSIDDEPPAPRPRRRSTRPSSTRRPSSSRADRAGRAAPVAAGPTIVIQRAAASACSPC